MPSFEKANSFFPNSFNEAPLLCFAYALFQKSKKTIKNLFCLLTKIQIKIEPRLGAAPQRKLTKSLEGFLRIYDQKK